MYVFIYTSPELINIAENKDFYVNIQLDSDGSLFGDTSIYSISGIAKFTNLYVLTENTYRIIATSSNAFVGYSETFIIKNYYANITFNSETVKYI